MHRHSMTQQLCLYALSNAAHDHGALEEQVQQLQAETRQVWRQQFAVSFAAQLTDHLANMVLPQPDMTAA